MNSVKPVPCQFLFFNLRYDVELYQRIEQLIGKKLPVHPMVEEEVMLLVERVTEAQRHAKLVYLVVFFNNFTKHAIQG